LLQTPVDTMKRLVQSILAIRLLLVLEEMLLRQMLLLQKPVVLPMRSMLALVPLAKI
jgi:hypothetical protein